MAKITYLLGAGASFYSCPILNNQAEAMIFLANKELPNMKNYFWNFKEEEEKVNLVKSDKDLVLWHIGYFGVKAKEFNTIDTYARKLFLLEDYTELNLLKMAVSVFFDLWEKFYSERYSNFKLIYNEETGTYLIYEKVDKRYISLFSIFLEKEKEQIKLNDSVKFISWNYDLQLEAGFKLFLQDSDSIDFEKLNDNFSYKRDDDSKINNQVFHLNGYRGFLDYKGHDKETKILEMIKNEDFEEYWSINKNLYKETINGSVSFKNYIKYAWEHNLNDDWFKQLRNVLSETDILIIIGYSFPLFNRKIDQLIMGSLKNVKEVVYQDPNANEELIKNLFENPNFFNGLGSNTPKLKIEKRNLDQFYIPHNHFITQEQDLDIGIEVR